jgi:hypothetical protein
MKSKKNIERDNILPCICVSESIFIARINRYNFLAVRCVRELGTSSN